MMRSRGVIEQVNSHVTLGTFSIMLSIQLARRAKRHFIWKDGHTTPKAVMRLLVHTPSTTYAYYA
jgi:hypothetical protein